MAKSRMVEARRAAKRTFARRRAEKREAERVRKAAARAALKAEEIVRKAAERAVARVPASQVVEPVRRPRGRPPKPKPRAARWTSWRPEFARRVYHAIKSGEIKHPDTEDLAKILGVTPRTIRNWTARHVAFSRAIDRGMEDRARLRGAILSCRRVKVDCSRCNPNAKSERAYLKNAVVKVDFDAKHHEELVRGGHLKTHMRRRWHERPPLPAHLLAEATPAQRERYLREMAASPHVEEALGVIEGGALSNRQIASGLFVGESTLRSWRKAHPEFDRAIHEAVDAYQERQAEAEHEAAWRRIAVQVARGLAALVEEDAYERGLIRG